MASIKTVRIKHQDVEAGILINHKDFDATKHELFDAPEVTAAREQSEAVQALAERRAARRKDLERMSAKEVQALHDARFRAPNKAAAIDTILDSEFGPVPTPEPVAPATPAATEQSTTDPTPPAAESPTE